MTAPRTQLETLLERRELAAYRAVSKIKLVLDFWEAQDYESAEKVLRSALADFDEADRNVNQLYEQLQKSNREKRPTNGIRSTDQQSVA